MLDHSSNLLLFGATGDLSRRMLLPSLYALHADGLIDPDLRIFGTARSALTDDTFRDMAKSYPQLQPLHELRTALAEALAEDERRNTMGASAKKLVERGYQQSHVVDLYESLATSSQG